MQNEIQIIPVILAFDEQKYQEKVGIVNNTPEFTDGFIQVDITDGSLTESKSVGLDILNKYPILGNVEVHLMVKNPLEWIEKLARLKVKKIIISYEAELAPETLNKIKDLGLEVGLGINPETDVDKIMPFVRKIDVLLILSVHPGLGGQEFIPETLEKIKKASKLKQQYEFKIEVDGGITPGNVKDIVEAGADGIVIGEHLIYGDIGENLENIWERINS